GPRVPERPDRPQSTSVAHDGEVPARRIRVHSYVPFSSLSEVPATTTSRLGSTMTDCATLSTPALTVVEPPIAKLSSRVPSPFRRATWNPGVKKPATTNFPSGARRSDSWLSLVM